LSKESYILMVFEGAKTEPQILRNLQSHFSLDKKIVKTIYETAIYSLYEEFFINDEFDEDLDLFTIIKEKIQSSGGDKLNNISREQVSEIYLFFDYDGHATNADLKKLQEILQLFNNETEYGKLYVSYPMVEAIKHLKSGIDFKDTIEESNSDYKKLVSENCDEHLSHLRDLSYDD